MFVGFKKLREVFMLTTKWVKVFSVLSIASIAILTSSAIAQDSNQKSKDLNISESTLNDAEAQLRAAEAALLQGLSQKSDNKAATPISHKEAAPKKEMMKKEVVKTAHSTESKKKEIVKKEVAKTTKKVQMTKEVEPKVEITKVKVDDHAISNLKKEIAALKRSNHSLKNDLRSSLTKTDKLMSELRTARNDLIVAESEVERLSTVVNQRNRNTLAGYGKSDNARAQYRQTNNQRLRRLRSEQESRDMPVLTVTVDKANLRTGPGKDNSPIMTVSKGTRLAVETRLNDWYRIITPTGTRAWVSSEVVGFGKKLRTSPTRIVKVKGYDRSVEDEAFNLIRNASR